MACIISTGGIGSIAAPPSPRIGRAGSITSIGSRGGANASRDPPPVRCGRQHSMRILVATDAWHPQVNGVVQTYSRLAQEAGAQGAELVFFTPAGFRTIPCPAYPGIRLAVPNMRRVPEAIDAANADLIHVATEGPIGLMARAYCLRRGRPFTTSYHTKFPEYALALLGIPPCWSFAAMRHF